MVLVERDAAHGVRRRQVAAQYCCYLKAADVSERLEHTIRGLRHVREVRREGEWLRLRWRNWKVQRKYCDRGGWFDERGITVYEADVRPVRRFLVDNDVRIAKPRRCYIDLETDPRVPIIRQIEGKSRVLCWSLVDEEGERVYGVLEADTDKAERELLEDLWHELLDYDQVCAWGMQRFDHPVLVNRSKALSIRVEPRRWLWLDHLLVFKRYNMNVSESGDEKESVALQRVAEGLLGEGEGKLEYDPRKNWEHWQAGGERRQRMVDYCVHDADLMPRIERETGYLELHFEVCQACTTLPDTNGTDPTNFVEGYLLKLGAEQGVHFRTMYGAKSPDRFKGAYVMEPTKKGLMRQVHVCDFKSLYPSILISWNMSPETLLPEEPVVELPSYASGEQRVLKPRKGECVAPITGRRFSIDRTGLLVVALERLLKMRDYWKKQKALYPPGTPEWKEADRRSGAYKIAANSFYGVQGSPFSRFFERGVAESIAQGGKWLLLETAKFAEEQGFEAVYADTDSLFVLGRTDEEFKAFVDWCNTKLYPRLLAVHGCPKNRVELDYEKKFSLLLLVGKKRYAGKYEHFGGKAATAESKPEIKGLEYKRGDTLKLARKMQWDAVRMLLFDENERLSDYRQLVERYRDVALKHELQLADVVLSQGLSKELDLYMRTTKKDGTPSALPPHVEVAHKMLAQNMDVAEGIKVEYVVVDGRSPIKAVPAHEFDGSFDRYYLWEALMYPPTMRVLQAAFPQHKWKDYARVRPCGRAGFGGDALRQGLLFD